MRYSFSQASLRDKELMVVPFETSNAIIVFHHEIIFTFQPYVSKRLRHFLHVCGRHRLRRCLCQGDELWAEAHHVEVAVEVAACHAHLGLTG